ncbi:RNHCP domain-containing protein [Acidaminobacter sp. JC074]|uniref:RNHCP domain-containing protein n=1 Tax=Acidaminobacter sp. JC074 TaxID=2530199 RepID=UPI001F0F217F|nr:RNHCP domain-containing protein [Acidaminobacter sp. JC074]MCH4885927.1 RNHCP domain-containing protein [Acidaminobacter sp. JC074]
MKKKENKTFVCENCLALVEAVKNQSYKNHCHRCLYSKHLDIVPGDRRSSCMGLMKPSGQRIHTKKGIQILHICEDCGHKQWNIIDESSDNFDLICSLEVI